MKLGVSFYYVGDVKVAAELYARLLGTPPSYADEDWVRFRLEGGDLALHLDENIPRTVAAEPGRFGAVVSLSVEDIRSTPSRARDCGFAVVGEVQDLPYGFQAQLRDPWGNRLSVLQPKEG